MTSNGFVSDSVWAALDPRAARLPRSVRMRVLAWCVAGAAAIAAFLMVFASGLIFPRLTGVADVTSGRFPNYVVHATVTNGGWVSERVTNVRTSQPGTRVISSSPSVTTIAPGGKAVFTIRVRITDCHETRPGAPSVSADIDPRWGWAGRRQLRSGEPYILSGAWIACHPAIYGR